MTTGADDQRSEMCAMNNLMICVNKKNWTIKKQRISYPKISSAKFFQQLQLSDIDFFQI